MSQMLCDVNPILKGSLTETAFPIQYLHVKASHFGLPFSPLCCDKVVLCYEIVTHLC